MDYDWFQEPPKDFHSEGDQVTCLNQYLDDEWIMNTCRTMSNGTILDIAIRIVQLLYHWEQQVWQHHIDTG